MTPTTRPVLERTLDDHEAPVSAGASSVSALGNGYVSNSTPWWAEEDA